MSPTPEALAALVASRWERKVEEQKPAVRDRFRAIFRTLGEPFTEVDVTAHAFVEALSLTPHLTVPEREPEEDELREYVTLSRRFGLRAHSAYVKGGGLILLPGLRRLILIGEEHAYCGEDVGLLAGIMALDFAPEGTAAPARESPEYARQLGGAVWERLRPPVS